MLSYGSVCSGIEAATVAWHPLRWRAAWLAEIEKFPSKVLAHHYPSVPNLGDMTRLPMLILGGMVEAPDVLVGGTPCQAFSVAGLRQSLEDDRGQLTLTYIHILDALDAVRDEPSIAVWENVPGVLNTPDNAFGCFLAGLAGEDVPLQPAGKRWTDAGYVSGPKRTVAWRVLDAQYFGVAQRRRRVFVVASAREGFDPAAVLFEFDGVRRDTAPSRETGESITHSVAPSLTSSGRGVERSGETRGQDPVVAVCPTLRAGGNKTGGDRPPGTDVDTCDSLICMAHGQAGAEIRSEGSPSLTCNHEAPIVAFPLNTQIITRGSALGEGTGFGMGADGEPAYTLQAGHSHAVATTQYGDVAASLTARHDSSPCADRGMSVVSVFQQSSLAGKGTLGFDADAVVSKPVKTQMDGQMVMTLAIRGRGDGSNLEYRTDQTANAILTPNGGRAGMGVGAISTAMQVRRLTPTECERLQGFPDGYTNIPGAADGPRYKALGNSMAVPVMNWIGRRLQCVI